MLDEAQLGVVLDQAKCSLFRLESRVSYDVASDGGDYDRYVRGEPGPDPARKGPWLERLKADVRRGLRNHRVHIVRSPLSSYLRYEFEWGYAYNSRAGEEIRVLDLAETSQPAGLAAEDFWLVDDQDTVRMHYDDQNRFLGAEIVDRRELQRYATVREALWAASRPFEDYWACHPQYRRDPA